jgi:sugar lactone lactonase YvrE
MIRLKRIAGAVVFCAGVLAVGAPVHTAVTVVMSGLDNPRGLAFGPEGALYVVEAGRGGSGPCQVLRGLLRCYGPSGAVSRYWRGTQERVITGLPSYAGADNEATGPHDISFQGRGGAFITIGLGGDPRLHRSPFGPEGDVFGTLVQAAASGEWRVVADVSAYEALANPDGNVVDTNPYGVLAEPGRRIVTDAGGNSLLEVRANGQVSTLAVFPARPGRSTDAVPTAVVQGPDGAYYVSELTGVPFTDGAARVYRVVPGQAPQVYLSGFKTIIDLAFGPDGSLYVLQHATGPVFFGGPGQLIRVAPNGVRTVVVSGLSRPSSVAIGEDGTIYISNRGTSVGTGEVLRFD